MTLANLSHSIIDIIYIAKITFARWNHRRLLPQIENYQHHFKKKAYILKIY